MRLDSNIHYGRHAMSTQDITGGPAINARAEGEELALLTLIAQGKASDPPPEISEYYDSTGEGEREAFEQGWRHTMEELAS